MSSTRSSRKVWCVVGLVRLWGWDGSLIYPLQRTKLYVLALVFLEAACSSKHDEEQRAPLLLLLLMTSYQFRSGCYSRVVDLQSN